MKKVLLVLICFLFGNASFGQKSIVPIFDKLTVRWDETALKMKNYQGIQEFCLTPDFQRNTIDLLDQIHKWDTTLYFTVVEKFDATKDEEARSILEDIEKLEIEYSTLNFKQFIQDECIQLKVIEEHFDSRNVKKYEKDIRLFEKELVKYINSITYRIDLIDEHAHHLKLD